MIGYRIRFMEAKGCKAMRDVFGRRDSMEVSENLLILMLMLLC